MPVIDGVFQQWLWNNPVYSLEGSIPFELGKQYPRRDGKMVTIVELSEKHRGYETARGDDSYNVYSGYRYNRDSDRGRCTATASDFSDPSNLLPEYEAGVERPLEAFLVNVSLLSANKTEAQRRTWAKIEMCEHELDALLRKHTQEYGKDPSVWRKLASTIWSPNRYVPSYLERMRELAGELQLTFEPEREFPHLPTADAVSFSHVLQDFITAHRCFYA